MMENSSFYSDEKSIERLYRDYLKYDTLYIAFDFDNTIWDYDQYKDDYNNPDAKLNEDVVKLLKICKMLGFTLILWTACKSDQDEKAKINICKKFGIEPNYMNFSPLNPGCIKPQFSLLLDDRAGLESAYDILLGLIYKIKNQSKEQWNLMQKLNELGL